MNLPFVQTAVFIFIGISLLIFAYNLFTFSDRKKKQAPKPLIKGIPGSPGVCPLCRTVLSKTEQIKSALFPGQGERICHIFGCPHCHPFDEDDIERICPVCNKKVPAQGYLFARLFERPGNKRHVHILGCTNCRLPKKT